MIRSAETTRKQIESAKADHACESDPTSKIDRILSILDEKIEDAISGFVNGYDSHDVCIDFRHRYSFPGGNISCQLAAEVKRQLQDAGYEDVKIFREMDNYHGEKRCVKIEVGIA